MKTSGVVLTFGFVDEILWRDYSNESSLVVLWHDTICVFFQYHVYETKFVFFFLVLLGDKGLNDVIPATLNRKDVKSLREGSSITDRLK